MFGVNRELPQDVASKDLLSMAVSDKSNFQIVFRMLNEIMKKDKTEEWEFQVIHPRSKLLDYPAVKKSCLQRKFPVNNAQQEFFTRHRDPGTPGRSISSSAAGA